MNLRDENRREKANQEDVIGKALTPEEDLRDKLMGLEIARTHLVPGGILDAEGVPKHVQYVMEGAVQVNEALWSNPGCEATMQWAQERLGELNRLLFPKTSSA